MMTTEEIITAFETLKTEDPKTFYGACGYGDDGIDIDILHPFYNDSYEIGLVAGAKYALDHWAATDLKDQLIEKVRKMREMQRKYFLTRDREVLTVAKFFETRVDELLAELGTPNLFLI